MNKKVLFSIFILFMFCVVSSPCIYAKTQNVSNETELKNALNDATIDEIKLTSNITVNSKVSENLKFNVNSLNRTLDYAGHVITFTVNSDVIDIVFSGNSAKKVTLKDSGDKGGIVYTNKTPFKVFTEINGNSIDILKGTYECTSGTNYFILPDKYDKSINCLVDGPTFYYTRNSPLSNGFNYNIRNMQVFGKGQVNSIGFFNDGNILHLADIVDSNSLIFCAGVLRMDDRNATFARDIYFNDTDSTLGIVIQAKSSITHPVTIRFVMEQGLEMDPIVVEKGTKLSKIPGPENGGLFLYAWCTDSALKNQYRFNTTPINDNLTLYPKWARQYSVNTLNLYGSKPNSGGKVLASGNQNAYYNFNSEVFASADVTLTAKPEEGCKFVEWRTDSAFGKSYSTNPVITLKYSDKTPISLYAIFDQIAPKGDINKDGKINADDAANAIEIFKTNNQTPENIAKGDMDGNGTVNAEDAALIIEYFKTHH